MSLAGLTSEQFFTVAQGVITFLLTIGIGLATWFVNKLFAEIEKSRNNERELYKKVAETREDMLRIDQRRLELENAFLKSTSKNS